MEVVREQVGVPYTTTGLSLKKIVIVIPSLGCLFGKTIILNMSLQRPM